MTQHAYTNTEVGFVRVQALQHLDLASNRMGDEGAAKLASALRTCSAMSHLDVRQNGASNGSVVLLWKLQEVGVQIDACV